MEMESSGFISELIPHIDDNSVAEISLDGGARPLTIDTCDASAPSPWRWEKLHVAGVDLPMTGRLKPSGAASTHVIAQL